jgi:hypothetical protein
MARLKFILPRNWDFEDRKFCPNNYSLLDPTIIITTVLSTTKHAAYSSTLTRSTRAYLLFTSTIHSLAYTAPNARRIFQTQLRHKMCTEIRHTLSCTHVTRVHTTPCKRKAEGIPCAIKEDEKDCPSMSCHRRCEYCGKRNKPGSGR